MKILLVTNSVRTYSLGHRNVIEPLLSLGHEVVWAANFTPFIEDRKIIPCQIRQIDSNRNPLKLTNFKAYRQLLKIIDEDNINAIYCSTPIGGLLARLAGMRKKICPVGYAAHGFAFYRGAPIINQTIYKWEELLMAHYTDALITINDEDFQAAQCFKTRSGRKPFKIHGAGVKVGVRVNKSRAEKRRELGIPEDAFVVASAGDLNECKNTKIAVDAVVGMNKSDVYYLVCGEGYQKEALKARVLKSKMEGQVLFLGFRTDIAEIMACADVFIITSHWEGISRVVLEAMDLRLPVVGSNRRGIRDMLEVPSGGYLCEPDSSLQFTEALLKLYHNPQQRKKMGDFNQQHVSSYSCDVVRGEMMEIFREVFGMGERR